MTRRDALMRYLDAALIAELVNGVDVFDGNFSQWCRINGIDRRTAYRHRDRILAEGGWTPRSQRPRSSPHETPFWVQVEIVRARLSLGIDNGAENIAYRLAQVAIEQDWASQGWQVPTRATINRVLKRLGLVTPAPKKKPKKAFRRFSYARPRDCYQIDATEVKLSGGAKAVVFEVLDDATRMLVAATVADAETAKAAITAITAAFDDHGVPAIVLSDNGAAFTSRRNKGGTSTFTRTVRKAGARLIHSSPHHPQTCGKVERHHQTFKAWLASQPASLAELQACCDRYRLWYNTIRRHSAVGTTPRQAWDNAPALGGATHLPIQADATVHTRTVDHDGTFRLGPNVLVNTGSRHAGLRVTVLRDCDHIVVYHPDGHPLGHLDLDPDKNYQGKLRPAA